MIGSFGSVTFQVSSSAVESFQNMKLTLTASYTQHKVHGKKAVPEFTGFDSDKITFDITLSAFLGINPLKELQTLRNMLTSKKAYSLALGSDVFGKWVIQSLSHDFQHVYLDGKLMQCKVSLTLLGME